MDDQQSVFLDRNAMSVHLAGEDSDDESDLAAEEQNQQELKDLVQRHFLGDDMSEDEDEREDDVMDNQENLTKHFGDILSEEHFGEHLQQRYAKGKMATSTPYAPSQRPQLMQQELSPWPKTDSAPHKIIRENWNHQLGSGNNLNGLAYRLDQELRNSDLEEFGKDLAEGGRILSQNRTKSAFDRVKEIDKSMAVAAGDSLSPNARSGAGPFTAAGDVANLLIQDNLSPQTREEQLSMLNKVQVRHIEALTEYTGNTINGLQEQVDAHLQNMNKLTEENGALTEELNKVRSDLDYCQKKLEDDEALLKTYRADMEQFKIEKKEVLTKLYVNEGTINQMRKQLEEMTSWETVNQLKTRHESMILQLKDIHESEMRKVREQYTNECRSKDQILETIKRELVLVKETLKESKMSEAILRETVANLERENSAKASSTTSDRRLEEQKFELLELQLRLKTEEVIRYTKKVSELEEKNNEDLQKAADESSKLRDDLTKSVQENVKWMDEQAKALTEQMQLREEVKDLKEKQAAAHTENAKNHDEITRLTLSERTKQTEILNLKNELIELKRTVAETEWLKAKNVDEISRLENADRLKQEEISNLKSELMDIKRKLANAEHSVTSERDSAIAQQKIHLDLQRELAALQKQFTGKTALETLQRNIDLLQGKVKLKEDEMSMVVNKYKEVEDRLHSQLRGAADENRELRDERNKLRLEIHDMKKILKKLKKYIGNNPSPSGDSGICNENKSVQEIAGRSVVMPTGDSILRERNYVKELQSLRGDYRTELEAKYQQQLDIDRKKIITQIDAIYSRKLQQVLAKVNTTTNSPGHSSNIT